MATANANADGSACGSTGAVGITRIDTAHGLSGMLWFAGWLFTIGFAKLAIWKAILALIAWPYFLGIALANV